MPTVFITVDAAINQLAAASSADRVLVHAAAGGVGLAAMQVIAAAGAAALTTAGSPAKRALLRTLGSCHVSSSRDTAFVTELAEVGGPTVVLNSLTSAGMVAGSLAALGLGGRFVEISKRDIWSAARVAQGEWVALAALRAASGAWDDASTGGALVAKIGQTALAKPSHKHAVPPCRAP